MTPLGAVARGLVAGAAGTVAMDALLYGSPWDSINGFTDALRRDGEVAWEHVRHEEAAAFAAAGEAAMTGLLGFTSAYRAMEQCDALLMLGTDFPYRPFFPEHARVIQVDVRGEHLGRRVPVDIGLVGAVKDTIAALLPSERNATHLARMQSHYRRTREKLDGLAKTHGDRGPIHPQVTAAAVEQVAADDAVRSRPI